MKNDSSYSAYVISNKFDKFQILEKTLFPEKINYFDGTNAISFARLVNSCVASCPTETVIIMSDKVSPNASHIHQALSLINSGYGFVSFYRFAFFGFKKELFRKIGCMDERFVGGGFEDDDFYIRMREANLSMYVTEEIDYERKKSSWNLVDIDNHFTKKWGDIKTNNHILRNLPEETYNYNLGPSISVNFKPWAESIIKPVKVKKWSAYPILEENR